MRKSLLSFGALVWIVLMATACGPPAQMLGGVRTKSPDGEWSADAITMQFNRAGRAEVQTTVFLTPAKDSSTRETVLVFPNEISKEKGKIDVLLHWPDRSHLEVLLSRLPTFDTQVIRYAGIDISVRRASLGMQAPPPSDEIKAALSSADLPSARRLMLDLHCTPATADQLSVVREAWHQIGSAASTEVTQDHLIQALMAECLIEAEPQGTPPDPDMESAVALLRSAIQSPDLLEALAGAIGLVHFSDPRDSQSIVDLTHRQPKATTMLRETLSYSCAPNAARALQLMRAQAPSAAIQDQIDANIKRAEPQRHERCDGAQ